MSSPTITSTLAALMLPHNLPAETATVQGFNATAVTSTTAQEVLPAADEGQSHYITQVTLHNSHVSEAATVTLQDDDSETPVELDRVVVAAGAVVKLTYNPPLKVGDGAALEAKGAATAGTVRVFAHGYTG